MFVRTLMTAATALALVVTTASAQKVVATKMGGGGSPHETVEWNVGGAKVTVVYGRPYLKGRKVLSDVAPAGKIRAGPWTRQLVDRQAMPTWGLEAAAGAVGDSEACARAPAA